MREKTCCFTGHRRIPVEEQPTIICELEIVISNLYQKGILYFEAGGALGFDTLAAQAVLNLREKIPIYD